LNKRPLLKSFLKDGEAESYQGISIRYVSGRQAVLTIYEDGNEGEKVHMTELKTKEDMHALLVEKGFVKKSDGEVARIMETAVSKKKQEEKDLQERIQSMKEKQGRQRVEYEKKKAAEKQEMKDRQLDAFVNGKMPYGTTMFALYCGAAFLVLTISFGLRRRSKRFNRLPRVGK